MTRARRTGRWCLTAMTLPAVLSGILALSAAGAATQPAPALSELARRGPAMIEAQAALREGNGARAVELLSGFDFGARSIEEYRLYYLANAYALQQRSAHARKALARLWARNPGLVYRNDVAIHLGDLYLSGGYWSEASSVFERLAAGSDDGAVRALANWNALGARLAAGDPGGVLARATAIATDGAAAAQGDDALAIVGAIGGSPDEPASRLTFDERIARAEALTRDGAPDRGLAELDMLGDSAGSYLARGRMILARANALRKTGKLAEADLALRPLFSGPDEIAIRALYASWKNGEALVDSLLQSSWRTVMVRESAGTKKVKIRGKWVDRPMYRNVQKRVQVVDARTRAKIDAARTGSVRNLKSLLALPIDDAMRREVLREIGSVAMKEKKQAVLEDAVEQLLVVDRSEDFALQYFWDQGWDAWRRRDLATARERFAFIYRTYHQVAARRQAQYWYARCLERTGEPGEAKRHYQELVDVPYEDVYALFARSRGASPSSGLTFTDPFKAPDSWEGDAERDMPPELRLAWELSRSGMAHDARVEIRARQSDANRTWSNAILAELYRASGSPLLVSNALRRAFPKLGTVEQDEVPSHFLRLYYPLAHREEIERHASRRAIDPDLVKGLVLQESGYEPQARSGPGAVGLMQLMPATAREAAGKAGRAWSREKLDDPDYNVDIGTFYLRELLDMMHGDEMLALAAYNAGFGNVQRWVRSSRGSSADEQLENIPFAETRGYVKRVMFYRSVYRRMGS